MNTLCKETIVEFLGEIFARRGSEEYLGEAVTLSQHMLQAATMALNNGEDEETIVAALLHDVGHFTSEFGTFSLGDTEDRFHEQAGAELLAQFFPPQVTDCVKYHVAAKRYLCATRPSYYKQLSKASVHSLKLQGGAMSNDEVTEFERNPHLNSIVKVRYLDDAAKCKNMQTPDFAHFSPMIQRIVEQYTAAPAN